MKRNGKKKINKRRKITNFEKLSLSIILRIILIFWEFQALVSYKNVSYKKSVIKPELHGFCWLAWGIQGGLYGLHGLHGVTSGYKANISYSGYIKYAGYVSYVGYMGFLNYRGFMC